MRNAQGVGRALLPTIRDLMVDRRANHAIAAVKEAVHVGPAKCGRPRNPGGPELRPPYDSNRHVAGPRDGAGAGDRRVVERVVGDSVIGVLMTGVQSGIPRGTGRAD